MAITTTSVATATVTTTITSAATVTTTIITIAGATTITDTIITTIITTIIDHDARVGGYPTRDRFTSSNLDDERAGRHGV